MEIANRLSQIRLKRGYSASELAAKTGVSRQTIYAMEAGGYVPNTAVALRLAQALAVTVEDLFSLDPGESASPHTEKVSLLPDAQPIEPGQPVQLCRVDERTMGIFPSPIAWRLPLADAVLLEPGKSAKVELLHEDDSLDNRLLLAGCDPGISVLTRHVQRAGIELVVAQRNSSQALALLKQGCVHIAGSHLRDEATGESNLPAVHKLFPRKSVSVISVAVWEEGIVVAKNNPKSIRGIEDFPRRGITIVNREAGAGSRQLLDSNLRRLGIDPKKIRGYGNTANGHLPAAWQVRTGHADCCVATRAAARVLGLDFIPLVSERYDLVVRKQHLNLPGVQALFDTLNRAAFRRELEGLGGYDAADAGKRIA